MKRRTVLEFFSIVVGCCFSWLIPGCDRRKPREQPKWAAVAPAPPSAADADKPVFGAADTNGVAALCHNLRDRITRRLPESQGSQFAFAVVVTVVSIILQVIRACNEKTIIAKQRRVAAVRHMGTAVALERELVIRCLAQNPNLSPGAVRLHVTAAMDAFADASHADLMRAKEILEGTHPAVPDDLQLFADKLEAA